MKKIHITPGKAKHATLDPDARAFSYRGSTDHRRTIEPGRFVVHVDDSSEDTPLHTGLTLN